MRSKKSADGRKPSFIESARREQIIDAAIATVAAVGYGQASLARIAECADISKSVISYHFDDKDDLLEQVVSGVYAASWASMELRLEAAATAAEQLRVYIESDLLYMAEHRSQLLAVGEIITNHRTPEGELRFATVPDESVIGLLQEILRRGQEDGEFRDFDTRVLAVAVSHAIDGAFTAWGMDPAVDMTAYAAELATVFDLATRRVPAPSEGLPR